MSWMVEKERMCEAQGGIGRASSRPGRQPEERSAQAQLAFLRSASGSAEGIIRLADEKAGYVLLFFGILVVTLSLRADSLSSLLLGPLSPLPRLLLVGGLLVFLGAAGASLCYAMQSRMLSLDIPGEVEGRLNQFAALNTSGLVEALGQALHITASIALRKLLWLQRSLAWAAVSFLGWTAILLMSVAM